MGKKRQGFVLYHSTLDILLQSFAADHDTFYAALDAANRYSQTGETPGGLSPMAMMAFGMLKVNIDQSAAAYEDRVEQSKRAAAARWGNRYNAPACGSMHEDAPACGSMHEDAPACGSMHEDANRAESKITEINGTEMNGADINRVEVELEGEENAPNTATVGPVSISAAVDRIVSARRLPGEARAGLMERAEKWGPDVLDTAARWAGFSGPVTLEAVDKTYKINKRAIENLVRNKRGG